MRNLIKLLHIVLIAALFSTATGCMFFRSRSPTRDFPENIRAEAHGALNYAESVIKSKGIHNIRPRSVVVEVVPGHRNFGRDGWSFIHTSAQHPQGIEVLGINYQNGRRIRIAHAPGDTAAINIGTLQHEMAHHWLVSNGYVDMFHYPEYDAYFAGWSRGRAVQGKTIVSAAGLQADTMEISYNYPDGMVIMTLVLDQHEEVIEKEDS